ncbi:MAG TPA: hypothetical protein VFD82_12275 [Planctomycetota bacterium]|nr:hypothetical protein [Planctomycetota bacterium]
MHLATATTVLTALCSLSPATAQAIIAQSSGLANPGQVINFGANLFPNWTPITNQIGGVVVTHAAYFTTGVVNNIVGGFLTNDFTATGPTTLTIRFAAPITELSFVYHQIGQGGPSVIRAVLQGVTVDSFAGLWNQYQTNNYFGFQNTVFDELQIDFQVDFNIDTLAFSPPFALGCNFYNGTNLNPPDFWCLTLPVLGTTWQGLIAPTPNTLLTLLVFAPGGLLSPVPLFGGELLVQLSPAPVMLTSPGSYSIPIPAAGSWTGTQLAFQGLRLDLIGGNVTFVPLNAMQLVLGP